MAFMKASCGETISFFKQRPDGVIHELHPLRFTGNNHVLELLRRPFANDCSDSGDSRLKFRSLQFALADLTFLEAIEQPRRAMSSRASHAPEVDGRREKRPPFGQPFYAHCLCAACRTREGPFQLP